MTRHTHPACIATLVLITAWSCGVADRRPSDDATTNRLPLTVRVALDSGNAAMRAKDYAGAIAQYRVAATGAPQHAAPWFGLHMAARAINDASLADSAMRMVQRLTNDSATLPSHEEVAAAAMPTHGATVLPPGHPPAGATPSPTHPPVPKGSATPP